MKSDLSPHTAPPLFESTLDMPSNDKRQNISSTSNRRTCFVTIGATASFAGLIRAVLTADFLRSLEKHKYTELIVQFGAGGEKLFADCQNRAREEIEAVDSTTINSIKVEGFPVDTQGLDQYMSRAKGAKDAGAVEGCVISHAGKSAHRPFSVAILWPLLHSFCDILD